jgi:hypothetical protein
MGSGIQWHEKSVQGPNQGPQDIWFVSGAQNLVRKAEIRTDTCPTVGGDVTSIDQRKELNFRNRSHIKWSGTQQGSKEHNEE